MLKRLLCFSVIMCLGSPIFTAAQVASRPNIVVIMIDDEDVASLELLVQRGLMPNLERHLLDVGFEFTEAFVVGSFGATTRAGFLTGQYPHNHHEIGTSPYLGGPILFNESSTVATWLRNAGYRTGLVGRYITGYGVHSPQTYIPPGWSAWGALVEYDGWVTDKYKINVNGTVVDFGALAAQYGVELYQTDVLAWLAGEFIRTSPTSQPFFLLVTPVAYNREIWPGPSIYNVCPDPTSPWYPILGGDVWGISQRPPRRYLNTIYGDPTFPLPMGPSFNEADITDKPWWVQQTPLLSAAKIDCLQKRYWRRLEVIRAADDLIGHVFETLVRTNTLSDTVVIFTGDSGILDGQHRYPEKGSVYEEVIRTPLVIRPRAPTAAQQITSLPLTIDLAPRIAQLAQATPTHVVDGRSLVPLMQNPETPWGKMALFEHGIPSWGSGNGELGIYLAPHFFALRSDVAAPRTFIHYPTVTQGIAGE